MGDPKKLRKKYSTPSHPWQRERIADEKELQETYGLKNKLEIWKANSLVKKIRNQARFYVVSLDDDATIKAKEFVKRLYDSGFINSADTGIDDVLTLKVENILDRRLQSVMVKKELVLSSKQARKFIAHKHVVVNGKVITSPSYLVTRDDELNIEFRETSPLSNENHPMRVFIKDYLANKVTEEPSEDEDTKDDKKGYQKNFRGQRDQRNSREQNSRGQNSRGQNSRNVRGAKK